MSLPRYIRILTGWLLAMALGFVLGWNQALEGVARDVVSGRQTMMERAASFARDLRNRKL